VDVLAARLPQYSDANARPILNEVLNLFASGSLADGIAKAGTIPAAAPGPAGSPPPGDDEVIVTSTTSVGPLTRAWVVFVKFLPIIVGLALAIIVAVWGFNQEYLQKESFGQSPWDFGQLFFWAVAVQVAGMTVATALGKFVPSR
jgi:hypothetical protein